jgi:glycosyltransferase involved in cell wall biosynthesis
MNHVAMVIPGIDRLGGAEIQLLQLARGLHKRQWRVTVVALSGTGGEAGSQLVASGIEFLTLKMRKGLADPAGWIRLNRWVLRNEPDVLHAHLPHAAWIVRWSRLFAPVRVVLDTLHTSAPGSLGRRLGYRCSNWLADAVTAVTENTAEAYLSAQMVSADRLIVIPNGVDIRHWKPLAGECVGSGKDADFKEKFTWLAAGRLEPVKNYPLLLDAVALLPRNVRVIIAGTGSMEAELRSRCADLGLASRVSFLGFDRELLPTMQAADALVLCSKWEGLPTVLLEAGACALPSVATDVPGSREVLLNGETGLIARPDDASALAEAMGKMMRMDPAERKLMGIRARQRVEARYCLESVFDQWDSLYRDLLGERRVRSRWAVRTPQRSRDGDVAA